ncbi:MAG: radical SAM protein [Halanaerobiales bacterium]|nr:radical SAM protein [Halanaerobiales bacterium]
MKIIREGVFFDYFSDRYLKSVQLRISHGCGENCFFCNLPEKEGNEVSFTPYHELKEGIIRLWEDGIHHFHFLDDTFLLYGKVVEKILKELEGMGITFSFASSVKNLIKNQKILTSFKVLGLRNVMLGIENSNQDVLEHYQINTTPMNQEYAIQILQALRIQVQLKYILFEPLTTIDHLKKDMEFLEKHKLLGLAPYSDILTSFLDLEEDTPIGRDYRKRQLYLPSSDLNLPYQIIENEVAEVFKWTLYFDREYGKWWNQIYQHLIELRMKLARENSGWMVTNTGQELMYITLHLRLMPYDFIKALISAVKSHGVGRITNLEIRRQCETKLLEIEEMSKEFERKM